MITQSPNQPMFDYAQMTRFAITRKDLPPDSRMINQPPSLIERFKEWMILFSGVFLCSAILTWKMLAQKKKSNTPPNPFVQISKIWPPEAQSNQRS